MLNLLLVEDNTNLRAALKTGLEATGEVRVVHDCDSGEAALAFCLEQGLALHSAMLAVVGGTLAVEPRAEGGTRVMIVL